MWVVGEGGWDDVAILAEHRMNGLLLRHCDRITKAIEKRSARWHVRGPANVSLQTVAQIASTKDQARQSVQRAAAMLVREGLANYVNSSQDRRARLLAVTTKGEITMAEINACDKAQSQHTTPQYRSDNLALPGSPVGTACA